MSWEYRSFDLFVICTTIIILFSLPKIDNYFKLKQYNETVRYCYFITQEDSRLYCFQNINEIYKSKITNKKCK